MSSSCHIILVSAPPTPPLSSSSLHVCVALYVLFEFCDYPLLLSVLFSTWRLHLTFPVELFSFPIAALASVFIIRSEMGEEEERERGGWWMRREGKRAWKAGHRGVMGWGVCKRERKMIVHVCQWELSPPDRFSAIDPVSRKGELIYSIHSSLFFFIYSTFLPLLLLLLLLWCLGMF